ncbi:MAG TPA: nucleotide disphospho-sugar-binding domain-containing protein [Burkholderiales bacterium]|nr:nucleotide disphospho-sugar-binding domain-containing protein [Burkholderiales bacterium]
MERPLGRILLATFGSLGDLHPYIAVARALAARGAQPLIATVPDYREHVEREGIAFAPVRPGMAEFGDYQALLAKLFDARRGNAFLIREMVMPYLRTTHEDLSKAAEGAKLLVSHPLTLAIPIIAEQRRLPWVSTVLSPASFMSSFDPPIIAGAEWLHAVGKLGRTAYRLAFSLPRLMLRRWEEPLHAFRRELGVTPLPGPAMLEGQFSPHLNLALFDPPLAPPQPDWPQNTVVTGAPLHDGGLDPRVQEQLDIFLAAGEPPLVFALGSSAVWVAGDFWNMAAEATRTLKRRAILITGGDTPTRLAELPPGIGVFGYLPYSMIFPRAAAVIHQAGIGTLSQALRSGRPQLIVPFAFDQPDNARRAARLGLARVLPRARLSAGTLKAELAALLADSRYAQRAEAVGRELKSIDGAARAADALLSIIK